MRSFVVAKTSWRLLLVAGVLAGLYSWCVTSSVVSATTGVYTTICVESSTVTIANPVSDSTVSEGLIILSGAVTQANQIEVYIDDAFDSTIPLTIGQTEYSSSIQIPTGTHTIRVEAVDSCGGTNATASSVVTFTPPPSQPSVGGDTPTEVSGAPSSARGNEAQSVTGSGVSGLAALPIPQSLRTPLENGLLWLGVDLAVENPSGGGRLTPVRAGIVIVSMSLLALGLIPRVRHALATSKFARRLMPSRELAMRKRLITWWLVGGAGIVLLVALFW